MIKKINSLTLTEKLYDDIINLYSNFSEFDKNKFTFFQFKTIVRNLNDNNNIFVYLDKNNNVIAAITLLIEQKIIHNGGKVGHVEDFVVSENYRNQNIGDYLINYVKNISIQEKCYKLILDCNPLMENYYNKKQFIKKGIYMAIYF